MLWIWIHSLLKEICSRLEKGMMWRSSLHAIVFWFRLEYLSTLACIVIEIDKLTPAKICRIHNVDAATHSVRPALPTPDLEPLSSTEALQIE